MKRGRAANHFSTRNWKGGGAFGYNSPMRKLTILILLLMAAVFAAAQSASGPSSAAREDRRKSELSGRKPVLLELFTAEGCPTCPIAEKNLAYLQNEQPFREAEIITLAFHVDYWDGEGWKDPFASPLFTQRQRVYDRKFRTGNIYTPQMVVDGHIEFIGTKLDKAEKAVGRSLSRNKAAVALALSGDDLSISIKSIPETESATVYLAVAEDGLSSAVNRGENAGKTLSHVSVVRTLTGLGRIEPGSRVYQQSAKLSIPDEWSRSRLKAVVLIQENHSRDVIGVGYVRLSSTE